MQSKPAPAEDRTQIQFSRFGWLFPKVRILFWAAIAIPIVSWFLVTLSWPMGRDQGILAWVGHVVRAGGMPYKDAWEVKGPSAFLPYALVEFLFGLNMWGIRLLDLFMSASTMAAVYITCREWLDRRAGWYAVIILGFTSVTLDFWMTAQPDGWCGGLIAIAIALMAGAMRRVSSVRFALAGACVSLCVLQKPFYIIYVLLFVPALVWRWREHDFWRSAAASMAGLLLPIIFVFAWFATRGALGSFMETFLLFNLRVHSQVQQLPAENRLMFVSSWLRSVAPFSTFVLPSLLGGLLLLRVAKLPAVLFALWFVLGIASVVVQRNSPHYHWFPLFPWLAAGTAIILRKGEELPVLASQRTGYRLSATPLMLFFFAFLYIPLTIRPTRDWINYRLGRETRDQYEARFMGQSKDYYWFPRMEVIADYVRARTSPDQSVLVWGFDAVINFVSDRRSPSRFGYSYPLEVGTSSPYQAPWRAEFLSQVRAHPPAYVVVGDHDENRLVNASSKQTFEAFRELSDFVHTRYNLETTIYGWDVWRLKG